MDFDSIPQSKEECKNNESNVNFDQTIADSLNLYILLGLLSNT